MIENDFDKVEYGYDENGNKFELSSEFKDIPGGARITAFPICHANIMILDYQSYVARQRGKYQKN